MELYLPTIIVAILLYLAGLWLKNYLPNYFNEKAKLLAQKEDIAEITEKIEKVKIEFTHDTEILKSGLQRLTNLEVSHRNEERNSIIEFYTAYNQWLYALLEINYGAYSRANIKDLIDKRIYIETFYGKTGIAQAKVKLLVKDDEIVSLSSKLWISILELKGWISKKLLMLQQNIEHHIYLTEEFLPMMQKFDEHKERLQKIAEEERETKKALQELIDDFYANKVNEYKKTALLDSTFTEKVKNYLTHEIITNNMNFLKK
jgi:hypothetical protein